MDKPLVSIVDTVIVWNDKTDIKLQDSKWYNENPRTHTYSWGACNREIWDSETTSKKEFYKRKFLLLQKAIDFMVIYKISPSKVNKCLMQLEEYAND